MYIDFHIIVEDKKAKSLLAFLKELDFVEVEVATTKPKKTPAKRQPAPSKEHLPFFGMCTDWNIEADELRKSGWVKRAEGW